MPTLSPRYRGELVDKNGRRIVGGYTSSDPSWMERVLQRWNAVQGQELAEGYNVNDRDGSYVGEYSR